MTESDQGKPGQAQSNQIVFTVLILLLIVVAGMQTWYIVGIKKQLNTIQNEQATTRQPQQAITEKTNKAAETENTTPPPAVKAVPEKEPAPAHQVTRQEQSDTRQTSPPDPPSFPDDSFFHPPPHAQAWDPYQEIQRMQAEMDRIFNHRYDYYDRPRYRPDRRPERQPDFHYRFSQKMSSPKMRVREDEDQYMIFVNTPGADEKDMSVELEGQRLTVRGRQQYKKQKSDPSGNFTFRESRSGKFQRSITLPEPVQQKGLTTKIENGVLTIIIPKLK